MVWPAQNNIGKITKRRCRTISRPWKRMVAPATRLASTLKESLNLVEHCGADIEPLEKADVPAFSPIQDSRFYFNYHHTAADTLDKIVPRELAENSAVVAVITYALANMEQP